MTARVSGRYASRMTACGIMQKDLKPGYSPALLVIDLCVLRVRGLYTRPVIFSVPLRHPSPPPLSDQVGNGIGRYGSSIFQPRASTPRLPRYAFRRN